MRTIYDLVDVAELTFTAREILERETDNRLRAFLPYREVADIDYRFVRAQRANRAASIRAFDTPAQRGRRPGATETRGSLPSISEILDLTESETLRLRRLAGTPVGQAIRDNIFGDAALTAQAVANRLELLRGEVLSTGRIAIDEGGVVAEIDYQVPQDLVVSAPIGWDVLADADPVTDLFGWLEAYNDAGNDGAGVLVTSTRVRGLMLRSPVLRELARGPGSATSIVTVDELNRILQAHGLPLVWTYDRKVEDADGVEHRVIPEGKVIFLPGDGDQARRLGETQMGVTEEAVAAAESSQVQLTADDAPGLMVVPLRQDHPPLTATLATCIGLPVLSDPSRVLIADVLSDPAGEGEGEGETQG